MILLFFWVAAAPSLPFSRTTTCETPGFAAAAAAPALKFTEIQQASLHGPSLSPLSLQGHQQHILPVIGSYTMPLINVGPEPARVTVSPFPPHIPRALNTHFNTHTSQVTPRK
ncbi:uncharacterized protein LOC123515178 [Portunus trituberculatus]|uniref:uncharacterized protein LOC123515178 n=1 Tax=Portunus trituberculatus TaxID=210409 RepID=UPI001E1D096F|nr:uncharacterized protein LOC123515178 [Portunus trituberculatus]